MGFDPNLRCLSKQRYLRTELLGGFKQVFHHIWDVILPIDELIFFKMFFILYPQPVVEVGNTVTHQTYSNMIIFQDII
jgi:hypothetical protein